jgi:hypothetical protein
MELAPDQPSIHSNLGMSYVLEGDLRTAERHMRKAVGMPGADSRVRQNLALVVGLQGRFQEAEEIARRELSAEQAQANVAYLRSMLSQDHAWSQLEAEDGQSGLSDRCHFRPPVRRMPQPSDANHPVRTGLPNRRTGKSPGRVGNAVPCEREENGPH